MHQCVRCGKMHEDGAKEILSGCSCGSRFFFFVSREKLEKIKTLTVNLSERDRQQIEHDVKDIVGEILDENTVILDLENVRILKPGQYEISIIDIFKGKPLVYKLEEGKYIVDIIKSFAAGKKERE